MCFPLSLPIPKTFYLWYFPSYSIGFPQEYFIHFHGLKHYFNDTMVTPKFKSPAMNKMNLSNRLKMTDHPMHLWSKYSMTKQARLHSGGKTVSSTNGAGKAGQLHVKK